MNFLFFKPQNGPPEAEISSDNECNFSPQKPGRQFGTFNFLRLDFFCDCVFGIFLYLCVCICLFVFVYFCLFFVFVFLIIFFCSLSLPADDDYHEFEPAGSKLNRSYFKMNPTSETGIWAYFSYFSTVFLYFCRSGRSKSVPPHLRNTREKTSKGPDY